MQYRPLGRTGVRVSALALGTLDFGGDRRPDPDESRALVHRAIDAGINFIDTANKYGGTGAERVIGEVIAERGNRDRLIVATKCAMAYGPDPDINKPGIGRLQVIRECEESLRRLQLDYLDLYYVHRPDPAVPIDETLRALDDLVRAGKVRYLGCSCFGAWRVVDALWAAKELGLNRFVADQSPYSLMDRQAELELIPALMSHGMGYCPYSVLAGGLLTGKYRRGHDEDRKSGTRYGPGGHVPPRLGAIPDCQFGVVEFVVARAEALGIAPHQYALGWVLSRPGVSSVVVGPTSTAQLDDALTTLETQVDWEAEAPLIDALVPPGHYVKNQLWGDHPRPRPNVYGWM